MDGHAEWPCKHRACYIDHLNELQAYECVMQKYIVFGTELQGTSSTTVSQCLKFLVTNICDLPNVISC